MALPTQVRILLPPSPTAIQSSRRPDEVLFVLLLAGVTFALSQTLVVPAIPALATELETSPSTVSWVLTGFLLSASVCTPIVGKLGDLYGKGRVLTAVMVLFAVGAVINALAQSVELLIAGRVLQGVAGGVFPLSFGIIRDTFPPQRMATGLGLVGAMFGIGGGIGLPLSGVIVDNADVSLLFWIGLTAVPTAVAAWRLIPPSPTVERVRIDWLGAALLSVALGAVLLAVSQTHVWGWGSAPNLTLLGGGLAVALVWLWVEARTPDPLIELRLLSQRAVAATNLSGFMIGVAMFANFFTVPQFAQIPESTGYGFGASVTVAGLLVLPAALAQLVTGPLAGRIGERIGFRATLAIGALLIAGSCLVMSVAHAHEWELVAAGVLVGAGVALSLAAMATLIVVAVPQSDVGIATGINTVMRTMGGSFGSATVTAILAANLIPGSPFPTEGAYTAAFGAAAVAGLLAFGAALLVPRPARAPAATAAQPAPATTPP